MLSESFRTIFHVEIYALIGFLIFFTFFILVSIYAFRMGKDEENELSRIPLEDSIIQEGNGTMETGKN